jgi:hypothetical protein
MHSRSMTKTRTVDNRNRPAQPAPVKKKKLSS